MNSTAATIFKNFVDSLGSEFAPGELLATTTRPPPPDSELWHLEGVIKYLTATTATTRRPFRFTAGRICSVKPTGYCSLVQKYFCIGVTTSMYYCCFEASVRCLQSDKMFVGVGQPDRPANVKAAQQQSDIPRPWGFEWRDGFECYMHSLPNDSSASTDPPLFDPEADPRYAASLRISCPVREACAHYVASLMMKFIWGHEFAHALSGHIPYLSGHNSVRTLSENDWYEQPQEQKYLSSAIRQWIEHDADMSAINTLLLATLQGEILYKTGITAVDSDRDLRLRLDVMAFVLTILIILFQFDWNALSESQHPDPMKRLNVGVMTAIEMIRAEHPNPMPVSASILQDLGALGWANRCYLPVCLLAIPSVAHTLMVTEYNDLVAQVSSEISSIRQHSYFDADGLLRVPGDT